MIDRVIDIRGEDHGIGIKNVTFNEPHFLGHFPDNPVMPGVLLIEGMAQTAGVLCLRQMDAVTRKERAALFPDHRQGQIPQAGGTRRHASPITSTRSLIAATCGGTAPKPKSPMYLIAEAEVGAVITEA